ncbi:hypothetical protein EW145_g5143 [Phellinidium pouzarii]|uniref:Uncharacterized protein n=1 Tax=Phellinidium pouzarii TaxID=167371 RepID=A0A4S4L120_9AGAM|nr:hypothetical protein EW145_g5143 [Phellinidium pouzarii]
MSSPAKAAIEAPLTISTLLNSLHTHLQTQTQLLPTLHAQLGLPQSALTDELSALHQRLAACVEQQIELRREEVDKWMKKCDAVERDCLKYTKALGAHTKGISASVGELHKQQVLPVRHEMLGQHREKLDHLYKTKVEQLTNLTNRVMSLSRTVGSDFFAPDIVELLAGFGGNGSDVLSLRDVTPERFSKIEKELVRGKSEISRRLQHLSTTLLQMDWLYHELGIPPPSCDEAVSSFPCSSSINLPISQHPHSTSASPSDPFLSSVSSISTPTPCPRGKVSFAPLLTEAEPVSNYHNVFALFVLRMDEAEAEGKAAEPSSLIGVEGIEPTVGLMAWAEQIKAELEEIKKRRETHIQAMYDQLEALWRRLGVEDADIDEFVENNRGSTEENVQSYEAELERMLELKRERMSVFVGNARAEIETLWDDLMISEEERADFAPFRDDEHTEDLLTIHENEVRRLKEERRIKAPLLANIRKYFEFCEEEKELAAAAMDQNRLLGRGPRDPGRLLREEKMRKRVSREKPRLEKDLLISIPAWEDKEGRPFLVNGVSIIDVLLETMGIQDKVNVQNKKTRAGSVPARATTPSENKPSALRSTSAASVPNKRMKLASSTSGAPSSRAVSSSRATQESYSLPHRAPFGSRSGALNASTSSNHDSAPTTTQKCSRTPSSSLPRPVSVASKSHPQPAPSVQRAGYGTGIGLGYASSMQRSRAASASAVLSKTRPFVGAASHMKTRETLQPKQTVRNSRRESFRPRPSVDSGATRASSDVPASRYGGAGLGSSVREEEEY